MSSIKQSKTGFASIDKPWLKYYPKNVEKTEIPKKSIFELLQDYNKNRMNKVALRYFDVPITYKKYIDRINETAKALINIGVKKDDIVVAVLPNVPESRILIYALNIIGAIVYPVSPMFPEKELNRIIKENKVENIFIFNMFYKKFEKILNDNNAITNIIVTNGQESIPYFIKLLVNLKRKNLQDDNIKTNSSYLSWDKFILGSKNIKENIKPYFCPNRTAVIIGTSGTTGIPKGVCLTNENLNSMALQHYIGDMNFEQGDKLLDILIQSIGYGIAVAHYSGVCGLESILIPELVSNVLPLLEKYKVSHFTGGPVHYEEILKEYKKNGKKVYNKVKNMVSGGASLSKELEMSLNKIDKINPNIIDEKNVIVRQGLGCTENGGAATYAKKTAYKFGGVGIPLPLENMGIFKPGTSEELPYNEEGEICISGPTVMKEYLNNKEETKKVLKIHKDGEVWLHTSDLGRIDEDGQVYILDRMKDIFMRKGFNVYPSKINDFISSIDIVDTCETIGVNHPDEQTVPVTFIKLKTNDCDIDKAKKYILEKSFENLEETSIPYNILFVENMPRNLGGKIDKKSLLENSEINYFNKYYLN